jgi:hypothetical protein
MVLANYARGRQRQMWRTTFGLTIAVVLADLTVVEVVVNPNRKSSIERDKGEENSWRAHWLG